MRYEFKLPDVGEGLHEAEIVRWFVHEGEEVAIDQPIAEIQTDKATVEISTPVAGKVVALAGSEGEVVRVGEPLIIVDMQEKMEAVAPYTPQQAAPSASPQAIATLAPQQAIEQPVPHRKKHVIAAPSVRKRAREMGIPIEEVKGTGEGGRVVFADLERYATERAAAAVAPALETIEATVPPLKQAEERLPIRGLRKKIAEKMVKSAYTAPHVTGMDEVDVTKLVDIRTSLMKQLEGTSIKLTYLPFVIKAVTRALKEHPLFNATLDEATNEIVLKKEYHIGIATATKEGLVVPVIRHADQKSIRELAEELAKLTEKAHRHTLRVDELQGSTFTITSTGANGGWFATPIINYPEVAILGVHAIKRKPVVVGEEIVIRDMMGISLTFDHRVIDGEPAGQFMSAVASVLEKPEQLLLDVR
ncbi:pyruvate dehydrogenase E2 component (dihydrolipoamide acetyltransferase) [Anoxybacillus voinovskiensis]|uniref:Dihydrolipoamide acetyltransferase component of pyruvate dehydrogenase complex n=1 Tax=Anoxybacteroides voinovskiense TaxID=230470 RepID=A0A840DYE9_9BACL|nr:dihydrolipoamide acetyltransferase family protein [Anoxybacillus voinovskiensis]MBB4074549.1 pyruvate dehydrogenase E2 component (dihydrolipoamide acetyltransferase) [Anoxybacillus voinovskiensis]GGJ71213.1 dihydrolipoamide acetyltransferase component of pyruvate dehydrogenase complex [Anoxybacillus voinovskiensis]